MTAKRPKSLKWIGPRYPDGRPANYLDDVPPRDLTEAETGALTQDQLTRIRHADPPLYREVGGPEPKKAASKSKAAKAEPDVTDNVITGTLGEEPSTAAEPATESEG